MTPKFLLTPLVEKVITKQPQKQTIHSAENEQVKVSKSWERHDMYRNKQKDTI